MEISLIYLLSGKAGREMKRLREENEKMEKEVKACRTKVYEVKQIRNALQLPEQYDLVEWIHDFSSRYIQSLLKCHELGQELSAIKKTNGL